MDTVLCAAVKSRRHPQLVRIEGLYTGRLYRRRGIGSVLVSTMLDHLQGLGISEVVAQLHHTQRAANLFRRLGFRRDLSSDIHTPTRFARLEYNKLMVCLGMDPGLGRIGWGIVNEQKGKQSLIDYGCLETSSKDPDEARLIQIYEFVTGLTQKYQPDVVAVEELFFAANSRTAFAVGQARGVIVLAAALSKITVVSYTPLQVKSAISGYGRAEKRQIQIMVKALLKMENIPSPDDAADALAVALTHTYSYKLQTRI